MKRKKGKRRPVSDFPPITRTQFSRYLEEARARKYVRNPELAMRDASLLAFEFLFKCRVSEAVGRTYPETKREQATTSFLDTYEGVTMNDIQIDEERQVLRIRRRILKRGRRKKICSSCGINNRLDAFFCRRCGGSLEEVFYDARLMEIKEWDVVSLEDPFSDYIMEWINYLKKHDYKGPIWNITRQRAWQIMNDLGIMNHTQRHWRATQLADSMDIFELKEALHRATIPYEYVHRSESRRLEKEREADEKWK